MWMQRSFRWCILFAAAALVGWDAAPSVAQSSRQRLPNPRLFRLRPCGAQAGATVEVTIKGDDLDAPEALVFSHPGITARLKAADTPAWRRSASGPFTVTVGADVPPGSYEVRVRGRFGLSTSWPFVVSEFPIVVEADGNDTRGKAMPIEPDSLIDGEMAKNLPNFFRFKAAAGQRLVLACESRLLNPKGNLLVQVTGPGGRMLASGCATRQRDPVLAFEVVETGEHLVQVIDSELDRFVAEGPYRMLLTTRPYLIGVWPPMAAPGTSSQVALLGHLLPAGKPLLTGRAGRSLEELAWTLTAPSLPDPSGPGSPYSRRMIAAGVDAFRVQPQLGAGPKNRAVNAVPVAFAAAPPVLEAEPNDAPQSAQTLSPPCDLAGRFDSRADLDWYSFTAAKGEAFAIEVIAERMGQEADVSLRVEHVGRDAQGREQVKVVFDQDDPGYRFFNPPFDAVSNDPAGSFTADQDGTYRIVVRNLAGRAYAESGASYRLVIRRPTPDVRLLATSIDVFPHTGERNELGLSFPSIPRLRRGGRFPIPVQVFRQDGFDKPVEVAVKGLPEGVTCRPATVSPGLSQTTLLLEAGPRAAAWQGPIEVVGTVADASKTRRVAGWATSIVNKPTPQEVTLGRLVDEMSLDVRAEPAPLSVAAANELPGPLVPGAKVKLPFVVEAAAEIKGQVRGEVRGIPVTKPTETAIKPPFKLLAEGERRGEIEFDVPAGLAPGEYMVYLVAQAAVVQARDPSAVAEATAAREAVEARRAELEKAAAAAKEQGNPAASKAAAELESFRKEEKQVVQQVTGVLKANEPQPTDVHAVSAPIRLVVAAKADAPPKAAARRPALVPLVAGAALTLAMADDGQQGKTAPARPRVDYNRDVKPILLANCVACHNAAEAEAGIVLESPQSMLRKGDNGPAVVPGKAAESLAYLVAAHTREPVMPPDDNDRGARRLTASEIDILRAWIDAGAVATADGPRTIAWQPLPANVKPVYAAAVSPDGTSAAAGIGNRIVIFDVATGKPVARLVDPDLPAAAGSSRSAAHRDVVRSLAFSPDGSLLASGAMRTVTLWKRSDAGPGGQPTWAVARRIGGPLVTEPFVDRVQALAFSPDGTLLATGGGVPTQSGEVVLVASDSGRVVRRFPAPVVGQPPQLKDVVLCLAFSPDGTLLATGGADRSVAVFKPAEGKTVQLFDDHGGRVLGIAWRGDGRQLASVGADSQCRFWNAGDAWERGETIAVGGRESVGIHRLGQGDAFAVAEGDGTLQARALGKPEKLPKFGGKVVRSQCLATDPAGSVIAVGGADGSLTIWPGTGGQPRVLADPGP